MNSMLSEVVDEILDSDGDVIINGIAFSRSYILKELDPIAYRELALNVADEHINHLQDELVSLDIVEDRDLVESLVAQIQELENV